MKALILAIALSFSILPAISASVFMPKNIEQGIKKTAKLNWPNDFQMQKYVIDQQTEAYYEIKYYKNKKVPTKILKSIIDRAQIKWPGDYTMQSYVIKNQV